MKASKANHSWDSIPLPPDQNAIGWKLVFKIKYYHNGIVERCNTRLVVKGDKGIKEKDFKHTFSHVGKFTTIRNLIVVAAASGWFLKLLDINNAFLHGYLFKESYMYPSLSHSKVEPDTVCKLRRPLYGLR